jgi:hypothetical protein
VVKYNTKRNVLDGLIPVGKNVLIRIILTDVAFCVKLLLFTFILKVSCF